MVGKGNAGKMLKMRAFHAVTREDMQHLIEKVEEDYVSKKSGIGEQRAYEIENTIDGFPKAIELGVEMLLNLT